jgi:hypothetical protein
MFICAFTAGPTRKRIAGDVRAAGGASSLWKVRAATMRDIMWYDEAAKSFCVEWVCPPFPLRVLRAFVVKRD